MTYKNWIKVASYLYNNPWMHLLKLDHQYRLISLHSNSSNGGKFSIYIYSMQTAEKKTNCMPPDGIKNTMQLQQLKVSYSTSNY